jgi:hypothetical protein
VWRDVDGHRKISYRHTWISAQVGPSIFYRTSDNDRLTGPRLANVVGAHEGSLPPDQSGQRAVASPEEAPPDPAFQPFIDDAGTFIAPPVGRRRHRWKPISDMTSARFVPTERTIIKHKAKWIVHNAHHPSLLGFRMRPLIEEVMAVNREATIRSAENSHFEPEHFTKVYNGSKLPPAFPRQRIYIVFPRPICSLSPTCTDEVKHSLAILIDIIFAVLILPPIQNQFLQTEAVCFSRQDPHNLRRQSKLWSLGILYNRSLFILKGNGFETAV